MPEVTALCSSLCDGIILKNSLLNSEGVARNKIDLTKHLNYLNPSIFMLLHLIYTSKSIVSFIMKLGANYFSSVFYLEQVKK